MLRWVVSVVLLSAVPLSAQMASGSVRGTVVDPSGAAIKGSAVEIANPVSHYDATVLTDAQGNFHFDNLPFNNYHVTVKAENFQAARQDVDVRSPVAVQMRFSLVLGQSNTSVTVGAGEDLVETAPETHTDVDRKLFEKLPLESQSSSLSSLVTLASPGVAADSNGLFHGLGDHASNSFSVDGQPITDQQSKVFSNQLPVNSVQSMEVIEGAPPAEYGDKTSLVIVVTTRSGLDTPKPHGSVYASYGSFGTETGGFDLAYGKKQWGNFITMDGMDTGRFLDGPEYGILHDRGNQGNFFDRLDYKPTQNDTFSLNLGLTRSWFQTPNSYDMQDAAAWNGLVVNNGGLGPNGLPVGSTDQRSKIRTFNIAPSWTRVIGSNMVLNAGLFARQDQFNYYPSDNPFADFVPDLQTTSVGQNRRLTNLGGHADLSYDKGIHNVKGGVMWEDTILTEGDTFGIVDPAFNAVCLNADGTPNTNPLIMNPAACTGALQPNPGYNPLLSCNDLTRIGTLPAGNGCPTSTSAPYTFNGHANIHELALYLEDTVTKGNWTFRIGLRGDFYNGITEANEAEPRAGASYHIKRTNTVLQVSYARTMETPFNENLVLSSEGCNDPVVNALMATIQGYPCLNAPLRPGWRNEFHAGLAAGVRTLPGGERRIHLEVHAPRLRFQRVRQYADYLPHRMGKVRRSRAMPSAPACRISTAFPRSW